MSAEAKSLFDYTNYSELYMQGYSDYSYSHRHDVELHRPVEPETSGYIDLNRIIQDFPEAQALVDAGWTHIGFWRGLEVVDRQDVAAMQHLGLPAQAIENNNRNDFGIESYMEVARSLTDVDIQALSTSTDEGVQRTIMGDGHNKLIFTFFSSYGNEGLYVQDSSTDADFAYFASPHEEVIVTEKPDTPDNHVSETEWAAMRALFANLNAAADDTLRKV